MRIRTYDEIDPIEAFRLGMIAFGYAWSEAEIRKVRRISRRHLDGFAMYAVERGRVLAQVVPLRFPVRLASGVEDVGGLGAVCSHPSVWGRGYARRLMEAAHQRFRELGLRISTLTTSRNIRGFGVYSKLGYVNLAPFYGASRRIGARSSPSGYRIRKPKPADLAAIQTFYRRYTRDLLGWTERPDWHLPMLLARNPQVLNRYRMIVHDGHLVGYLRTRPTDRVTIEEAIVPKVRDFRGAVALLERTVTGGIATANWLTAAQDVQRFRRLGYSIDGPIADATMALPLTQEVRSRDLPGIFGATTGRFVQYPTDDF